MMKLLSPWGFISLSLSYPPYLLHYGRAGPVAPAPSGGRGIPLWNVAILPGT